MYQPRFLRVDRQAELGETFSEYRVDSLGVSGTATGIDIANSTGAASFTFADTTVSSSSTGVNLASSATTSFTFADLDITTTSGSGLFGNSAGTIATTGGTINATNGAATDIQITALNLVSVSPISVNSTGDGLCFSQVTGTVDITGTTDIDNPTDQGIDISSSSAGFTFADVDIDNTGNAAITIKAVTGTVTFSGTSKTFTNTTGAGIELDQNTGGTITFSGGGLDIDTTTGLAFNASGGGTVNVTGANNSITTTTGTVLAVVHTGIRTSGLTFRSISVNGATNGIVLDTTGMSGGLTVTGDGGTAQNGSSGTIQNTTGDGINRESHSLHQCDNYRSGKPGSHRPSKTV